MEVFIQDVPAQLTDDSLQNLLRPYMDKLSIKTYHCQKPRQRQIAFLTFLTADDGKKFLLAYGQEKPSWLSLPPPAKITVKSVPIFCTKSTKPANQHILRMLEKEDNDRRAEADTVEELPKPKIPREFPTSFLACGTWGYADVDLVYSINYATSTSGSLKFRSRTLVLQFGQSRRIDFLYTSINEIMMESTPPFSITLTLWEAPRSYILTPLGQQRQRASALSSNHLEVVGTCLIYRIFFDVSNNSSTTSSIASHILALQKSIGLPPVTLKHTGIRRPQKLFSLRQQELDSMLSDSEKYPFWTLNFQIRALASNAYLSFDSVLSILPHVQEILGRSGLDTSIATLRRFGQILSAGKKTDDGALKFDSLIQLLQIAEDQVRDNEEGAQASVIPRKGSEDMAMIHRIVVTPAGVYLYGPEAEPMNRNYDFILLQVASQN